MNKITAKQLLKEAKLTKDPWGNIIIIAEQTGHFDNTVKEDAGSWKYCPCGLLDERIIIQQTFFGFMPKDLQLERLGYSFYEAVKFHKFVLAARRLIRIKKREAKLLKGRKK